MKRNERRKSEFMTIFFSKSCWFKTACDNEGLICWQSKSWMGKVICFKPQIKCLKLKIRQIASIFIVIYPNTEGRGMKNAKISLHDYWFMLSEVVLINGNLLHEVMEGIILGIEWNKHMPKSCATWSIL